jgi:predicted transcriptional regulator
MCVIWENEPVNSTRLVKLANDALGWKKSTTYTILRKLKNRGILKNENAVVTSILKMNDSQIGESREFVDKIYSGSFAMLLTNFLDQGNISGKEIEELKKIIDTKIKKNK